MRAAPLVAIHANILKMAQALSIRSEIGAATREGQASSGPEVEANAIDWSMPGSALHDHLQQLSWAGGDPHTSKSFFRMASFCSLESSAANQLLSKRLHYYYFIIDRGHFRAF
jgi:hypothetical protein